MKHRLAELSHRFGLSARATAQFEGMLTQLERDELAPTTVRAPAEAVDAHFADSLVALELEATRSAREIADLGSGPGFPGLALAVALPNASVRLVESQRRKCQFLERMRVNATLDNVEVICSRIEEWRGGLSTNDLVVARALAPQPVVLEYAAPLLRPTGVPVDWRGKRTAEGERAAARAASLLGLRRLEIRAVAPFAGAEHRHLHVFEKVGETPPRFPRRSGVARKRPLG